MTEQTPKQDPISEADRLELGALVRNAATAFAVPFRRDIAVVEMVPHVIAQPTMGMGKSRSSVSLEATEIRPPIVYLADAMGRARAQQDYEAELIGEDEGFKIVRVTSEGEPIVSPALLLPEVLEFLKQEPDFAFADDVQPLVFITGPAEVLLVDSADEKSGRGALELAYAIYQQGNEAVTPLPYVYVDGRLEDWQPQDEEIQAALYRLGAWFDSEQYDKLKSYFSSGREAAWLKKERLTFVDRQITDEGFIIAQVRHSDLQEGALLIPAVQRVVFINDDPEFETDSVEIDFVELENAGDFIKPEPGMRPHMFRVSRFPDQYEFDDLRNPARMRAAAARRRNEQR